jgi:hypothetical protein
MRILNPIVVTLAAALLTVLTATPAATAKFELTELLREATILMPCTPWVTAGSNERVCSESLTQK